MTAAKNSIRRAAFVLVALASAGSVVSAQTTESRWQPWLGCWVPEAAPAVTDSEASRFAGQLVCVIPTGSQDGVDVVNITGNRISSHIRLAATGNRTTRAVADCSGWERGDWSADNRRIMLESEFDCANGVKRRESGLMAMSQKGEWVQVQFVSADLNDAVYVGKLRYADVSFEGYVDSALVETPRLSADGKLIPVDRTGCTGSEAATPSADGATVTVQGSFNCSGIRLVSSATFQRTATGGWQRTDRVVPFFSTATARMAAGSRLTADAIVEVADKVRDPVVEAWLADRAEPLDLSGKELTRLARRGIPAGVIDLLVALDNPGVLYFNTSTNAVAVAPIQRQPTGAGGSIGGGGFVSPMYVDPWLSPWDPYGYRYRYGLVDAGYLYRYGTVGGYGCWGCYPYSNGMTLGYGSIYVTPAAKPRTGIAVAGQGYTRPGTSSTAASVITRAIQLRRPDGSAPGAAQTSSSGGSSSGSAASSGGASSSGGRTAKQRGN